jgi:isoaspartyl peptidase/L-asparaginase-like protein (Ntn-hydrolase superfamily)
MEPIILSTWSFGQRANAAAWKILASGGSSLEAAEAACRDAESDVTNHTVGKAGYPDASGRVSLDASIMLSPSQRGAVAFVRNFEHPISIARAVMEKTDHVMLVGDGAEEFARQHGFEPTTLLTDEAKTTWEKWRQSSTSGPIRNIEERKPRDFDPNQHHDTLGVLAIDSQGTLAGACSTSGLAFKLPGRVGDSPIIGHGLYVDPNIGAAVATGHGELVMSVCGTFLALELLRRGASPIDAAAEVLERIREMHQLTTQDQVGLILLRKDGQWASAALREGFKVAVRDANRDELLQAHQTLLSNEKI